MAFPTVEATATSVQNTAVTSHTVTLPTGIVNGSLVIAAFAHAVNEVPTWPAGWTNSLGDVGQSFNHLSVVYRSCDGTEGATITVTTSSSKSAHCAYRLAGHEAPATQAPQGGTSSAGSGSADPPLLTPTGGAKDYLWLAFGQTNQTNDITALPANYTNFLDVVSTGSGGVLLGSGRRTLNAASENPGTFTMTSDRWDAATVAVHPGAAASEIGLMASRQMIVFP